MEIVAEILKWTVRAMVLFAILFAVVIGGKVVKLKFAKGRGRKKEM